MLLLCCCYPQHALKADGKPFARKFQLQTADQQAILIDRGDEQEIIIRNQIAGKKIVSSSENKSDDPSVDPSSDPSVEMAWIVPLPAKPEISTSQTHVFNYLDAVSQPRFQKDAIFSHSLFLFAFLTAIGLLAIVAKDYETWVLGILFIFLLLSCLLPSLGSARGASQSTVLVQQETVGAYDTAILYGENPSDTNAVISWLKTNGFKVSSADEAVFKTYIKKNWYFAAIRLRTDLKASISPHPLRFRFKSKKTLYPMMLTGSGQTQPIFVDLFVFSRRGQANDDAFATLFTQQTPEQDTDATREPKLNSFWPTYFSNPYPALENINVSGMTFTRLRRHYRPEEMNQDVTLTFQAWGDKTDGKEGHDVFIRNYFGKKYVIGIVLSSLWLGLYSLLSTLGRHVRRAGGTQLFHLVKHITTAVVITLLWYLVITQEAGPAFKVLAIAYVMLLIVIPYMIESIYLYKKRLNHLQAKGLKCLLAYLSVIMILGTASSLIYAYSKMPDRHVPDTPERKSTGGHEAFILLSRTIPLAISEELKTAGNTYASADELVAAIRNPENNDNQHVLELIDAKDFPERGAGPLQWQIIKYQGNWRYVVYDLYGAPFLWGEEKSWTYFPEILEIANSDIIKPLFK